MVSFKHNLCPREHFPYKTKIRSKTSDVHKAANAVALTYATNVHRLWSTCTPKRRQHSHYCGYLLFLFVTTTNSSVTNVTTKPEVVTIVFSSCLVRLTIYYSGEQIKGDEIGWSSSTRGKKETAYTFWQVHPNNETTYKNQAYTGYY
jgi:hypothetical protein